MPENLTRTKKLERWVVRRSLGTALYLTRLFPVKGTGSLSRVMAGLGYYVLARNRKLALANLSLVYGRTKSPQEIREMAREILRFGARCAFELMLYVGRGQGRRVYDLVKEMEGLEHLDKALQKGKGVVGLTSHLGNFILLAGRLNSLGYRCTSIMRQMRDEQLEQIFCELREAIAQKTIPKFPLSRSVRESLSWLSRGNILALYIDQRSKSGAVVDFLGVPTSTATGAAFFALKSKAPVLPMFAIWRDAGYYKLVVGPEVEVIDTGKLKADTYANTARFAKVVESYIRRYPTQWFWFDNRWRRIHESRRSGAHAA
jgi:KDO2-lipid IV(A) lauroyltransferase